MAVIGCYSLDLYCDAGGESYGTTCKYHVPGIQNVAQFTGRNQDECLRAARKNGWTVRFSVSKGWKAICPRCTKDGIKP